MFNEADDLRALGRLDEALQVLDQVRALHSTSPGVLSFLEWSYASVLVQKGDFGSALDHTRRAIRGFEAEDGTDALILAPALLNEGDDLVGLGRAAEAIAPLEQAKALFDKTQLSDRADVRFSLARALVAAGRDRVRATALATEAETILAPWAERYAGVYASTLTKIRAWRAARPGGSGAARVADMHP
jgi:tetratricopeptide (TPR) repeat protein